MNGYQTRVVAAQLERLYMFVVGSQALQKLKVCQNSDQGSQFYIARCSHQTLSKRPGGGQHFNHRQTRSMGRTLAKPNMKVLNLYTFPTLIFGVLDLAALNIYRG